MKKKRWYFEVPEDVSDAMKLEDNKSISLNSVTNTLEVRNEEILRRIQQISLQYFIIPTIICIIAFYAYLHTQGLTRIPLAGDNSIADITLAIGAIDGLIMTLLTYFLKRSEIQRQISKRLYWRSLPTILISILVVQTMITIIVFWFTDLLFSGAVFDYLTAGIIFALFIGISNYGLIYLTLSINPRMLVSLLISIILGGAISSMISNRSLEWWRHNISFLGTKHAYGAWQFNLTLLVSAGLLIVLIDYIFISLRTKFSSHRRLLVLRSLLTSTAIFLGGVGAFPNNGTGWWHYMHDRSSDLLILMMIVMICLIKWLIPTISNEFLILSIASGILLVTGVILFKVVGYLSLTAFELISFITAFTWLLMLLQTLLSELDPGDSEVTITIKSAENK